MTFKTSNDEMKEYVGLLATKFLKEIPDTHAFIAELEVFNTFFNSLTEENPAEVSKIIESAAKICSDTFLKQHLFPSVHIGYLNYF